MVTFFSPGFDVAQGPDEGVWKWVKIRAPRPVLYDRWTPTAKNEHFERLVTGSEFQGRIRAFVEYLEKQGYEPIARTCFIDGPKVEPTEVDSNGNVQVAVDKHFYAVGIKVKTRIQRLPVDEAVAAMEAEQPVSGYSHELAQFSALSEAEQEKRAKEMVDLGKQADKEREFREKILPKYKEK